MSTKAPEFLMIPGRKGVPVEYALERLPDGDGGERGWQLSKLGPGGEVVDVFHCHDTEWGLTCTCASFVYVKEGKGEPCKHLWRLREEGLL